VPISGSKFFSGDTNREFYHRVCNIVGGVISPLLSNIYLDELDHKMAEHGYEMVRYADDFVILSRSREEAEEALEEVKRWTAKSGLTLHPEKTRIVDAPAGKGGVRLPRVPLRARDEMATQEEPEEAEGDDPAKDEAQQWSKPTGNHQRREPHDEGLV